jgi:hypothetical protein
MRETDNLQFGEQGNVYYMVKPSIELTEFSSLTEGPPLFDMQRGVMQSGLPIIPLKNKRILSLFTPYSYSFDSYIESVIIKGFHTRYSFTDYLSVNMNVYLSKGYFRNPEVSNFYLNGSVKAELVLKLHDRVQLTGVGHLSLREGLDPKIPSLMGGCNYYGAGMQFKIINNVGVGIGFTNSYYRSEWTKRTYIIPVGY